jgi:hypothetical protein
MQKLPDGVLSKHGYTVQWSFFSGICAGAGELPYEQSCDLIRRFVEGAQAQRERLVEFRESLLKPATEAKAWFHEYVKDRRGLGSYQWRMVELEMEGPVACYRPSSDAARHGMFASGLMRLPLYERFTTLMDAASLLNAQRAKAIGPDLVRIDQYVAWQEQRIADWKPAELVPVVI